MRLISELLSGSFFALENSGVNNNRYSMFDHNGTRYYEAASIHPNYIICIVYICTGTKRFFEGPGC